MKNKLSFVSRNCTEIFLLAATLLLTGSAVQAQLHSYYLTYRMMVGSTDSGTQANTYDSGEVQSTNYLTVNLVGAGNVSGPSASASATPTASYGQLQLTGTCSVQNNNPNGYGRYSLFNAVGNAADVFFQDTLTVTSTMLPVGTPVQIQITSKYSGFITPGVTTADSSDHLDSFASVGLQYVTNGTSHAVSGLIGGVNQSNSISLTINTVVGGNFSFSPSITANGAAVNSDSLVFSGSISTSIMSRTYVDVLTSGAAYTSASGTVYSSLLSAPPSLTIQPATNGVILLWPASGTVIYRLQQNSSLTISNWMSNTIPINVVNGTNQVTISPAAGNLFFRLINP